MERKTYTYQLFVSVWNLCSWF